MGFSTDAIHAGQHREPETGAVVTPIYMTSTYQHLEFGKNTGYTYGRAHNVTRESLEKNVAALEKGKYGIAFSSGIAAVNAVMSLLKPGDHIVVGANVYGGTIRLFTAVLEQHGLEFTWVDTTDTQEIQRALKPNTRMVYFESPSNPLLQISDIRAIAALCAEHGCISATDNTFMTPYFQQPLTLGIDVVIHSTTKYLNGHSDVIGGLVITSNDGYAAAIQFVQKSIGAVPSPFDCWLTLRSTKTLALRMEKHQSNAMQIAEYLSAHPAVQRVLYPGLPAHPHHDIAKRQSSGFGGVVSFYLTEGIQVKRFLDALRIITLAESLGGVESLIGQPFSTTHQSMPPDEKRKLGITENLIRLSVGIEDAEDLIADLTQALEQ